MSTREPSRQTNSTIRLFGRLTRDRRDILDALDEQSLPVTECQLAAVLTDSRWRDRSTMEARTRLRHVDLPKLTAAGHITWDDSEGIVTEVTLSTEGSDDQNTQPADSTGTELEDRLRIALNLIETLHGTQHERDIAYGVAAITGSSDPDSEAVEEAAINVRHRYLPKLDQAALVEYDPEEGTVATADSSD